MDLNLLELSADLKMGTKLLADKLQINLLNEGIPVHIVQRPGLIEVCMDGHEATIRYGDKIHFYRAFGLLVQALRQKDRFEIIEEPQFEFNGMMFDVSRNAVLSVSSIRQLIMNMAVMGLNGLMLYTEDMFTIESNPYFGYMRGKYSYDELKECDDLADLFGIEVIPCIQTLAHVEQALKWNNAENIRDTHDIFLVGEPQTYEYIERMISNVSLPFRSKRIHIGMDEAHFLGLGKYLQLNGSRSRFEIMTEHLNQVLKITDKLGLRPMIWSDMYFRLGSTTGDYYDKQVEIPQSAIDLIPANLQFVYWDYYHHEVNDYRHFLRKHLTLGSSPIFAGGVWTWNGLSPNYYKTLITTHAGLTACKQEGIKQVFSTMWGDNGGETNLFCALPGMQLFAEHGYSRDVEDNKLKERFAFCTGGDYDAFMQLEKMDLISEEERTQLHLINPPNPSKFLLWQDILLGLFDKHAEGRSLDVYYADLEKTIQEAGKLNAAWAHLFQFYEKLCAVLKIKSEIGLQLKAAYDANDINELDRLVKDILPDLHDKVSGLRNTHRTLWMNTYKPQGWEVIDIRYGGVLARIDTACYRLSGFINGEIDQIEELQEERLFFDGPRLDSQRSIGNCNAYHRIVSASTLS